MWSTTAHVENIPTENFHVVQIQTIFLQRFGRQAGHSLPLALHPCRLEKLTSLLFWWDTGARAACVFGDISCTHLLMNWKQMWSPWQGPLNTHFSEDSVVRKRYPGIVFLSIIKDRQTDPGWFFRRLSRVSNLIGNRYPDITLWLCVSLPLPERSLLSSKVSHWLQHWLLLSTSVLKI